MKRKCKKVNIRDFDTIRPWVEDCIMRHKKRYDFRKLLLDNGMTREEYNEAVKTGKKELYHKAIDRITIEAANRIGNRNLDLPPVRIREMHDKTTDKIRQIGWESAMQQVFDYIAVHSCQEIWEARIVREQASSIPGRGQIYGMRMIRKAVKADYRAERYAKKHGYHYSRKLRYFVKLDIKKCYPSADLKIFMELLKRDCGNEEIIWLWNELLSSHKVEGYNGFMIGALISQWGCQLMLSYIYRYVKSLHYEKRGRKYKSVQKMYLFMDDMLLFGSNRTELLKAVRKAILFTKDKLGFTIKQNFMIHDFFLTGADMMGFVIYSNGKVEMRSRNYIRSQRLIKRCKQKGYLVISQAKRLTSYKGYYIHSDYHGEMGIFRYAQYIISKEVRNENNLYRIAG